MTHHDMDREAGRVRDAIVELREADARDARSASSFHAVLRRKAASSGQWRFDYRRAMLAASLVALAVLGYRMMLGRSAPLELPREVAALAAWRPMTDVLLDTPGRHLLRGGMPLGASILDVNFNGALR